MDLSLPLPQYLRLLIIDLDSRITCNDAPEMIIPLPVWIENRSELDHWMDSGWMHEAGNDGPQKTRNVKNWIDKPIAATATTCIGGKNLEKILRGGKIVVRTPAYLERRDECRNHCFGHNNVIWRFCNNQHLLHWPPCRCTRYFDHTLYFQQLEPTEMYKHYSKIISPMLVLID